MSLGESSKYKQERVKERDSQKNMTGMLTAARLAQWDKRLSAEREAVGSNPGRTNTQGL